jgi:hypothetical protein
MPRTAIRLYRGADRTVPMTEWLAGLEVSEPRAYVKCLAMLKLLSEQGNELRRPHVDMLRDGIRELRFRIGTVQYRILFFYCGQHVVCLSHGITKENVIPPAEIDTALIRKRLVERDPDGYTADWEL